MEPVRAESVMRGAWRAVAGAAAPADLADELVDDIADDLVRRHEQPARYYHAAEHVMWVLQHIDDLLATPEFADVVIDRDAVVAAALFHDAVYDPTSGSNEHDSASLAAEVLAEVGWPSDRIRLVTSAILATAGHVGPHDDAAGASGGVPQPAETAILLDADLAILGAPPAEYRAYARAVRNEYGHVPDDGWRTGRASVLRSFLDRPHIFITPSMRARREGRARANMLAELAELASPDPIESNLRAR